jgi:hypothetical protein
VKSIFIAIFLISISSTVNAQSIGDLAKAERQRKQETGTAKLTVKQINPVNPVAEPEPVVPAAAVPPAVVPPVEQPKNDHSAEQASLEHEKAALLMKLTGVIHDRQAVQEIEQRLAEIQRRSSELKSEPKSEPKVDNTTKPEQKSDSRQK